MEMDQIRFSGLARQQDLGHRGSSFPMKRGELMCFYLTSTKTLLLSCRMGRKSLISSGYPFTILLFKYFFFPYPLLQLV